ncbi:MBOAT-2 domain containing protein [Pyrenophora tritici-repentis]|nr:MBOAT-2 domain-containing protein [Pyrenophora tritici-repentis]KAG9383058.1 MBOAT-2 domain containing protein [Pyrenophora tritici-repentis]KAI0588574.1 MBOAT-2 domain-containing protein [Pyrenophora tritici-repentis]KAI0590970.1 MBOAT-2 domain-containing protein [Pyrenophora tritici-repentis]KAI0614851.1 MBOAT-2 domain-containing protein [Pyrenophora tritici-repentis]
MCIIAIPVWYAFRYCDHVSHDYLINDTFARTCIIWLSHASYEICVLEFKPLLNREEWGRRSSGLLKRTEVKERFYQARKVLCDRNHVQVAQNKGQYLPVASDPFNGDMKYTITDKKTDEHVGTATRISHGVPIPEGHSHGYTRWKLVRYHIVKWLVLRVIQLALAKYESTWSPMILYQDTNHTFSPTVKMLYQIYCNFEDTIDWCFGSIMLYDSWHSVFAILFLVTYLDEPQEWSLSLFGNIKNAWSVRSYWSRHWHNFIYHSFNGHIKCVTRGWLAMKRGTLSTRLTENTAVFFLSGLMHTAVRWQMAPWADIWAITFWYVAQMVPIITETAFVPLYRSVRVYAAKRWQFKEDAEWVVRMEYAAGYFWVAIWFGWSIPMYYHVRDQRTDILIERLRLEYLQVALAKGNRTE